MNSFEKVVYLVKNTELLVLATADKDGKPWISPLGFIADADMNLYWVSSKNAIHSKNIRERKQAAITIVGELEDGDTEGAYFDVEVFQLDTEQEATEGLSVYGQLEQPEKWRISSIQDITGQSVWRIYKATPLKIYKRISEMEEGRAVTAREEIELES